MSMFGEIAIEGTIKRVVVEIRRRLEIETSDCAKRTLKSIGLFALTQFDWTAPEWSKEYSEIFKPD